MKEYRQFKEKVHRHMEALRKTVGKLDGLGAFNHASIDRWNGWLDAMRAAPHDESLLRVAVIGAVKSGKSTLINSLLGRDLLKRGAGIITAFITRVRTGGVPGGWIELKPWPLVLEEVDACLRMLPLSLEESGIHGPVDLHDAGGRELLRGCLERVRTEWQQEAGQLDPCFLMLKACLEGYPDVADRIGDASARIPLDAASLALHRDYVGRESRAVYVRDMELCVDMPWLGEDVEMADCQGSDSPNPLHLDLLQRHLLRSHFIVYVVNSRTGLREADFKLLEFVKTLRMLPQTSFVLNVDLDAHPHEDDLRNLLGRVREELAWVAPNPRVYALSALHALLSRLGPEAPERERGRFELWQGEAALVELVEKQFNDFRDHLARRIGSQRARLLMGSTLSRLNMVAANVMDGIQAKRVFLDEELSHLQNLSSQLEVTRKALTGTLTTLENAISGLQESLRTRLEEATDRALDAQNGSLIRETLDMVERFPADALLSEHFRDGEHLMPRLHRFYTDFRRTLARYLVEKVNVRLVELAREQEASLQRHVDESSRALWGLFQAALDDYRRGMASFQIELHEPVTASPCEWSARGCHCPPTFSAFLDRDALSRGALLVKFGLGRVTRFLAGIKAGIGKGDRFSWGEAQGKEAVLEAVALVKGEMAGELIQAFREYGESFKTRYLHEMIEDRTRQLLDEFRVRAETTQLDFESILKRSELEGEERQALKAALAQSWEAVHALVEELEHFRCAVQLDWLFLCDRSDRS